MSEPPPPEKNQSPISARARARDANNPIPARSLTRSLARSLTHSLDQMAAKYSFDPVGSGFMVFSPGFHPAGHTSSGLSCVRASERASA